MEHLSLETLARLVDESGDVIERDHLMECERCARELAEMRGQSAELAALPRLEPRADSWAELHDRLVDADLIRSPRPAPPWRSPALLRIAAALALFAGGALVGGVVAGSGELRESRVAAAGSSGAGEGGDAEALELLRAAEDAYLAALMRYSELTEDAAMDPLTRLAALESIVLASRAALQQAPADPVINGYYLTALGERERMMRQLVVDSSDPWF
jgi:hypothetical protein